MDKIGKSRPRKPHQYKSVGFDRLNQDFDRGILTAPLRET